MYINQLYVSYQRRYVFAPPVHEGRLPTPCDAAKALQPLLGPEVVEVFGMLCLTMSMEVIAYHELSRGTIDTTVVHARDVFRAALLVHAAAIIIAHNHPSGDVTPTRDDEVLTERLRSAGEMIGVAVADHLIVSMNDRFFSFQRMEVLPVHREAQR